MKKLLNGKYVDMTPEEIALRLEDDAAYAAEQAKPKPKTIEERLAEIEKRLGIMP